LKFYEKTKTAIDLGVPLTSVLSLSVREDLSRLKIISTKEFDEANTRVNMEMDEQFEKLVVEVSEGKPP
jgi:hypothetical protein